MASAVNASDANSGQGSEHWPVLPAQSPFRSVYQRNTMQICGACSELERAAIALASAKKSLSLLAEAGAAASTKQSAGAGQSKVSASSITELRRGLQMKGKELELMLLSGLRTRLSYIWNGVSISWKETTVDVLSVRESEIHGRAFAYCLRSLSFLGRREVVEKLLLEQIIEPFTR